MTFKSQETIMSKTATSTATKEAKLLEATDKPGISVKLDDSSSDTPCAPKVLSATKESKTLDADDKPAQAVKAEASPTTETTLDNTDSVETASEMAKEVEKKTDDYVTKGEDTKADDSSSAIKTERESEEPMRKKQAARRNALIKLSIHALRKKAAADPASDRDATIAKLRRSEPLKLRHPALHGMLGALIGGAAGHSLGSRAGASLGAGTGAPAGGVVGAGTGALLGTLVAAAQRGNARDRVDSDYAREIMLRQLAGSKSASAILSHVAKLRKQAGEKAVLSGIMVGGKPYKSDRKLSVPSAKPTPAAPKPAAKPVPAAPKSKASIVVPKEDSARVMADLKNKGYGTAVSSKK